MEFIGTRITYPKQVLTIYASERSNYYIETHDVINGKLLAGKPLEPDTLKGMAKAILKKDVKQNISFKGIRPDNFLHFSMVNGRKKLLWLIPSQLRRMSFTPDLKISDGNAHQPDLLFFVNGNDLSVFAVKEKKITDETELYLAPFLNVGTSGQVCLGTTRTKNHECIEDMMTHWENIFYGSYFSHAGGLYAHFKFNMNQFWKDLIESQNQFPSEVLLPCSGFPTVSNLLNKN